MGAVSVEAVRISPTENFYYGALPPPLAKRTKARAERIQGYGRQTVEIMGKIGQELLEAQDELEHGLFLGWVAGLGMSKSAAYRAMDVAKNLADKLPKLGSLPVTVVQEIGSSATPEPVRKAIIAKIEAGEPIKAAAIKSEIQTARHQARQKAEMDRREAEIAAMSPAERKAHEQKNKRQRRTAEQRAREEEERQDERDREVLRKLEQAMVAADLMAKALSPEDIVRVLEAMDASHYLQSVLDERFRPDRGRGIGLYSARPTREVNRLRIVIENRRRKARGEPELPFDDEI